MSKKNKKTTAPKVGVKIDKTKEVKSHVQGSEKSSLHKNFSISPRRPIKKEAVSSADKILEIVNNKITKVRTKSLDLSFNEILDMYKDGEFVITPEYQRLFRWSSGKQSRFIETLILEMPVPPLYAIETESGSYELIDGLQRISSYLNFRGILKPISVEDDSETDSYSDDPTINVTDTEDGFTLMDCDIVPELNGLTYSKLPGSLKIRLKRSFVRIEILRKESEQNLKYYMFKRLNTGGEKLSEQEIRNCTIRLADPSFYNFIVKLSLNKDFKNTISSLANDKISQKYDHELVIRFFVFKNWFNRYKKDVSDFITEYMESVSGLSEEREMFDYEKEKKVFEKTFSVLNKVMGDTAFSKVNKQGNFISLFIVYQFEAFVLGIQKYLNLINTNSKSEVERIKNAFIELKQNSDFQKLVTGGGKNTHIVLKERVKRVEDSLEKIYSN